MAGFAGRALPAAAHARLARAPATPIEISGQFGGPGPRRRVRHPLLDPLGPGRDSLHAGQRPLVGSAGPARPARCIPATTDPGGGAQRCPGPRHAHRWGLARPPARRGAARPGAGRRPEPLIADEPTSQLDLDTGRQIMRLLLTVVRSEGITALVATHDEALIDLADSVLRLEDGRVQAGGPATGTPNPPR